ncbi:MAG: PLD nuclease N-terminal domain-containing protein [Ilumatobacteraceae bacterium]
MNGLAATVLVSVPLLALLVYMMLDVARRRDLHVTRRIVWIAVMLLVPIAGMGLYIVVRPPRAIQIRRDDGDLTTAEQIVVLAEQRQRGELGDDDYHERVAAVASLD